MYIIMMHCYTIITKYFKIGSKLFSSIYYEENKQSYLTMPDSLYGTCLQGIMVVVFIFAKSRACFDVYNYHDFLQVRTISRENGALDN